MFKKDFRWEPSKMRVEIYCAYNTVSKKCYVGKTKNGVAKRIKGHLKNNKSPFQLALNKYSLKSFRIGVVATVSSNHNANRQESFWIRKLDCKSPNGYNLTDGGDGLTGAELAVIARIAATKRGKKHTPEHRANMRAGHAKRPEVKRKKQRLKRRNKPEAIARRKARRCKNISKALSKHYEDPVNRQRCAVQSTGRVMTPEQNAKNAAAKRAQWEDPDWRANQIARMTGRKDSEETKQKKSIISTEAWKKPERRPRMVEVLTGNTHTKGMITLTDGVKKKLIKPGAAIPVGFYIGHPPGACGGKHRITDGIKEMMVAPDAPIPEGWKRGRSDKYISARKARNIT